MTPTCHSNIRRFMFLINVFTVQCPSNDNCRAINKSYVCFFYFPKKISVLVNMNGHQKAPRRGSPGIRVIWCKH